MQISFRINNVQGEAAYAYALNIYVVSENR